MKLVEIKSLSLEELIGYDYNDHDGWHSMKGITLRVPAKKLMDNAVSVKPKGMRTSYKFKYGVENKGKKDTYTYSLYFSFFQLSDGTGIIVARGDDGVQAFGSQPFHVRKLDATTLDAIIKDWEKSVKEDDLKEEKEVIELWAVEMQNVMKKAARGINFGFTGMASDEGQAVSVDTADKIANALSQKYKSKKDKNGNAFFFSDRAKNCGVSINKDDEFPKYRFLNWFAPDR